ncbi:MAG: nuclear transport factor 2 family protein [Rhizobiaceae bacterium]
MAGRQDFADVVGVLEAYFEGLYRADSKKLAEVFHRDARYVNTTEGDYMNHSILEYLDIIDRRTPPASSGELHSDRMISIEFGGPRMAFAKVAMTMLGRDYLDFLTLILDDGQWWIISKVFSYIPKSQET